MTTETEISRRKQVVVGVAILLTITTLVFSLLMGWRHVPGLAGEWLGVLAGFIGTPFLLEGFFVILGMIVVVCLNNWRRAKEGDEFVYLEQVSGPDVPVDLPDQAKWAVFREEPLPVTEPSLVERAEGAVAIGDFEQAAAWIAAMSQEEMGSPAALSMRIGLAEATGKRELAERLRGELEMKSGNPP